MGPAADYLDLRKNYGYVRDFIRSRFIIRAVVSLHGTAVTIEP
jgi:hypothetical protein